MGNDTRFSFGSSRPAVSSPRLRVAGGVAGVVSLGLYLATRQPLWLTLASTVLVVAFLRVPGGSP